MAGVILILILIPAISLWTNLLPLDATTLGVPTRDNPRLNDFAVFYSAGLLIRDGRGGELYDLEATRDEQERLTGQTISSREVLPYFNPPFFAAAVTPLTLFPFETAAGIYSVISALVLVVALAILSRLGNFSSSFGPIFVVAALASVAAHDTIFHGQTSTFLLLAWVVGLVLLRRGSNFKAGLFLGLLLLKPQLALLPIAFFLVRKDWSLLRGFATFGFGMFLISILVSGPGIVGSYTERLLEASLWDDQNGIVIWAMFGWNAFVRAIVGPDQGAISIVPVAVLGALTLLLSARVLIPKFSVSSREFSAQYGVLAVASLLLSPHFYSQDLLIAIVPLFILLSVLGKPFDAPIWRGWALLASLILFFHWEMLARYGLNLTTLNLAVLLVALSWPVLSSTATGGLLLRANGRTQGSVAAGAQSGVELRA